jgi:hypothetical protein
MKRFTLMISVLVVLLAGTFTAAFGARTHYIRYGDTLWELSIQYYDNPFYWEEILRANPTVRGVEYLIPGEELIIPDLYGEMISHEIYDPIYSGSMYTTSGTSSRPLLSRLVLETSGMVTATLPTPSGYVLDTDIEEEDPFEDYDSYTGDLVGISIGGSDGVEPDMIYRIFEVGEAVVHPVSGALLGNVVRVAGICRVLDVDATSSVALLEHSNMPVNAGDFLLPYDPEDPIPVTTSETVDEIEAYVIAFQDPDLEVAYSYDIIYIDRGSSDGLKPGDIFNMYKYGAVVTSPDGSTETLPDIPVSQLIILETQGNTSAAMVYAISTTDLIVNGDRLELVRRQI